MRPRGLLRTGAALAAAVLAACATPAERFDRRAADSGLARTELAGEGFRHVAYAAGVAHGADTLHVYLEHDGTPWADFRHVSPDPTPRTPFALELMVRDSGPRLLLGRPCYFAAVADPGCSPMLWTHRRYAPEVVASMVAALRGFLAVHPFRRVVLIGYSGGGTLAWLMAPGIPQTTAVVAIAANVDTDAWTRHHGYAPLEGSLNPALLPALPAAVVQRLYVGGRDPNVPPSVVRSFALRHAEALVIEMPDFDHRCCWIEQWPRLLAASALPAVAAGRPRD